VLIFEKKTLRKA